MKLSALILCSSIVLVSARVGNKVHRKLRLAIGERISGQYIVAFNKNAGDGILAKAKALLANTGAMVTYEFDFTMRAVAVSGLVANFLTAIMDDDMVEYVEEDQLITADSIQTAPENWALDRIDSYSLPLDNSYSYSLTGKGVTIFVLDTGINFDHTEFTGRASCGYSAISDEDCEDFRGHGSHVSGVAAGTKYGVAKDADIVSIKVLNKDGNGSTSGVVAALEYVMKEREKRGPIVTNMSLGGGRSASINVAVNELVSAGVVVVSSAGNNGGNACDKSPASAGGAITIAATNNDDSRGSYSNYGTCVDIFAPGTDIFSAGYSGSSSTNTLTGTSMATPLASGVAALYLERDPSMSPESIRQAMIVDGAKGVVSNAGSYSPDILLSTAVFNSGDTTVVSEPPLAIVPAPIAGPSAMNAPPSSSPDMPSSSCGLWLAVCDSEDDCCSKKCTRLGLCSFWI